MTLLVLFFQFLHVGSLPLLDPSHSLGLGQLDAVPPAHTTQSPFVSKKHEILVTLCEKNQLPCCIPRQRRTVTSLQTLRTCNVLSLKARNVLHLLAMTWEHLFILPKQPAKYPSMIQTKITMTTGQCASHT